MLGRNRKRLRRNLGGLLDDELDGHVFFVVDRHKIVTHVNLAFISAGIEVRRVDPDFNIVDPIEMIAICPEPRLVDGNRTAAIAVVAAVIEALHGARLREKGIVSL